jgi:hypothetical protein
VRCFGSEDHLGLEAKQGESMMRIGGRSKCHCARMWFVLRRNRQQTPVMVLVAQSTVEEVIASLPATTRSDTALLCGGSKEDMPWTPLRPVKQVGILRSA